MKFVDYQPLLAVDNYEVDNTYEVDIFFENQISLVTESLDKDPIETIESYLQETNKPRTIKIENYIRRVKTLNNYPLIETGAVKLTERELIKTVVLKTISVKWTLDVKRAIDHNLATLAELQSVLKPIEEANESEEEFRARLKLKNHPREGDRRNNERERSGNMCKKPGYNHNWRYCLDNKYGSKYKGNESHTNKER